MRGRKKVCGGFTLVEMVAVLGILSALLWLVMPLAELHTRRARESELRRDLAAMRDAIDAYKRMSDAGLLRTTTPSGYPPSLLVLVDGVDTVARGRVYLLRRLPQDPFSSPSEDGGWALRSYASPPDRPAPGDDVFDVHSGSTAIGLDGTPVATW